MPRKSSNKKYIHVNQHKIRANLKHGTTEPVITIKEGRKNTYCHEVEILGPSKVVYRPDKPLSCGARVWIETESEVNVINEDLHAQNSERFVEDALNPLGKYKLVDEKKSD